MSGSPVVDQCGALVTENATGGSVAVVPKLLYRPSMLSRVFIPLAGRLGALSLVVT